MFKCNVVVGEEGQVDGRSELLPAPSNLVHAYSDLTSYQSLVHLTKVVVCVSMALKTRQKDWY